MMMSFSSQQELNLNHLGAGVYILKSEWRRFKLYGENYFKVN
jgi:hypothetical protein